MKKKHIIIAAVILAVIMLGVAAAAFWHSCSREPETVTVSPGKISRIESFVRLCAIDVYSEVPVLDTVNNKVMFGIQKQRGSISFDVDSVSVSEVGDTLTVILPRERIELYEATDDNAWEVIDTKAIGPVALLRSDKFTVEEENEVKSHIREASVRRLYSDGTVSRARAEGAANLKRLLENVYRRPVTVIDPGPTTP